MNHRHLLPDEIDQLLDEEVGFGIPPLKGHVRECPECRSRLQEAQVAVDALKRAPHLAPSHDFADRIMAQVPVFVPWHVAAADAIRQWIPASRPARIAVAALATSAASILTIVLLWVGSQTNALVFASGVAGDRLRAIVAQAGHALVGTLFGDQVFTALQRTGTVGIALALLAFAVAAAGTVFGLRSLALSSSKRRA